MAEHPCDLNDVMRAIGNLEGKVDGLSTTIAVHGSKLDGLTEFKNQQVGKATVWGAVAGGTLGLIGSLIQGGFFHK